MDTMRALRAAVAEPSASAAASTSGRGAAFSSPYPGDYADFFRAFAGHVETVAPALGVQLEDWGVRFTGEQAARDLPTMQVSGQARGLGGARQAWRPWQGGSGRLWAYGF